MKKQLSILLMVTSIFFVGYYIRDNWVYSTFTCSTMHSLAETQFAISIIITFIGGIAVGLALNNLKEDVSSQ